MKPILFSLGAAALLTSCAGVRVAETQTAAVVTEPPSAIYVRPFSVDGTEFVGHHAGGAGERPIRQSLAPIEFSEDLKEELEKLAPARVLRGDEVAEQGWLVEGSFDTVDAGSPAERAVFPPGVNPLGRSHIRIHVRVTDLDSRRVAVESKDSGTLRRHGRVIYEFDVEGGSRLTAIRGSINAPGFSSAAPFDYRNAAERIRHAIEPDAHHYGVRTSATIR